jgi:lipopolysaccharide biosynthesis glycosyltransferase
MKKRLIVTIMFGKDPSFYFAKKTFKDYSKKVNADFLCLQNPTHIFGAHGKNKISLDALFQKISLGDLSCHYQRVLYVDADILITPNAKDIFNLYPDNSKIYMFNEGLNSNRAEELNLISIRLGRKIKDKNYFNAGVILLPHKTDFLSAIKIHDLEFFLKNSGWFDQTYVNYKSRIKNLEVINLDREFNYMAHKDDKDRRFLMSFIHYAGNGYCPKKQRPLFMLRDYCDLYNYSLTTKEKVVFAIGYIYQRLIRIKNKFIIN